MSELVVSNRDALVVYFHEARMDADGGCIHASDWRQCEIRADALLASGVVRPLPDEETVREKTREHVHKRHPEWHDRGVGIVQGSHYQSGFDAGAAWALALFTEGAKE